MPVASSTSAIFWNVGLRSLVFGLSGNTVNAAHFESGENRMFAGAGPGGPNPPIGVGISPMANFVSFPLFKSRITTLALPSVGAS